MIYLYVYSVFMLNEPAYIDTLIIDKLNKKKITMEMLELP
jgi:hypothetical protein